MKHRCKVSKMQTGHLWKVQCKSCPINEFGLRIFTSWLLAYAFAYSHCRVHNV